ncbi:MAG: hypothetical protein Kow0069_07950 [Promethearchaeota archaeon]
MTKNPPSSPSLPSELAERAVRYYLHNGSLEKHLIRVVASSPPLSRAIAAKVVKLLKKRKGWERFDAGGGELVYPAPHEGRTVPLRLSWTDSGRRVGPKEIIPDAYLRVRVKLARREACLELPVEFETTPTVSTIVQCGHYRSFVLAALENLGVHSIPVLLDPPVVLVYLTRPRGWAAHFKKMGLVSIDLVALGREVGHPDFRLADALRAGEVTARVVVETIGRSYSEEELESRKKFIFGMAYRLLKKKAREQLVAQVVDLITVNELEQVEEEFIRALGPRQLRKLRPEQLRGLSPEQLRGLSPEQLRGLSPEQLVSVIKNLPAELKREVARLLQE